MSLSNEEISRMQDEDALDALGIHRGLSDEELDALRALEALRIHHGLTLKELDALHIHHSEVDVNELRILRIP